MPIRSSKIAISLDASLLARAERLRSRTGESRSALIGRALTNLTQAATDQHARQRYVAAYQEQPETAPDVGLARQLARRATKHLAWDEDE